MVLASEKNDKGLGEGKGEGTEGGLVVLVCRSVWDLAWLHLGDGLKEFRVVWGKFPVLFLMMCIVLYMFLDHSAQASKHPLRLPCS